MSRSIHVLTFPRDDVAFRTHVEAAQARLGHWAGPAVQDEIRKAFPSAVIRAADAIAQLESGLETWYAYRDGRITPSPAEPEWWADERLPKTVLAGDGVYVDGNEAAAQLFGVRREQIAGAPAGSFTRHEDGDDLLRRLLAVLSETGEMHSTAIVVRPDGTEQPVEFHTSRGERPGEFATVFRPIAPPVVPVPVPGWD